MWTIRPRTAGCDRVARVCERLRDVEGRMGLTRLAHLARETDEWALLSASTTIAPAPVAAPGITAAVGTRVAAVSAAIRPG